VPAVISNLEHRVLIANDELFLLHGYLAILESYFEVVICAENGMQALQIAASNPVDYFGVIILDINMPIMDGLESCLLID
jgi:YesN/AraC family two-component response regulator